VSAAYYGIFHAITTKAVDQFVGATNRDRSHYGLAYRSVSHSRLREVCSEVQKSTQSNKYRPYVPTSGFGSNIVAFAEAVLELQERRHSADYDVMISMTRSDAALAIGTARAALGGFDEASQQEKLTFLRILLFSPR
jgi:hypothetical protein